MQKLLGVHQGRSASLNPLCPYCKCHKTWKNKLVLTIRDGSNMHPWNGRKRMREVKGTELRGYYRCCQCLKYFYGESFKYSNSIYDDVPNCHKCGIGRPLHKLGGHNTPYGRANTYRCKNCGDRYTVSPCMKEKNPRLKRKISAKECLRLRTEEFLSYKEIAKIAGISKSAVMSLLGEEVIPDW